MKPVKDITIVVTNYNQNAYLKEAFESAKNQVVPQDRMFARMSRPTEIPSKSLPPITVIGLTDVYGRGASKTRNNALEAVETSHVLFLDADDLLPSHYVYYLLEARDNFSRLLWGGRTTDYSIVGAPTQWISGRRLDRVFCGPKYFSVESAESNNHEEWPTTTVSYLLDVDAVRAVGGFDEKLKRLVDIDLFYRMLKYTSCYGVLTTDTFIMRRYLFTSLTATAQQEALDAFNAKHNLQWTRLHLES